MISLVLVCVFPQGFKVFNSFGQALEQTASDPVAHQSLLDRGYVGVLLTAADSLAKLYSPIVGLTRSWRPASWKQCRTDRTYKTRYPVIIDNVMNIELLFWAAARSGNLTLQNIAVSHMDTTADHFIRPDGSTFHVLDFDPDTGNVIRRCTAQGLADHSTWARGQAWALYGFTMAYRYSGLNRHLRTARTAANLMLDQTELRGEPADGIPLWDFNWEGPQTLSFRDSSAAAVAASGLLELATYGGRYSARYLQAADTMLISLAATYLGDYERTQGVLLHAAEANPAWRPEGFDVSLVYGDYYALEAVLRRAATVFP